MAQPNDTLLALIAMIKQTGFVNVTCNSGLSPRTADIDLPGGIIVSIDYKDYQTIREAAGLPDDVCEPE